MEQIKCPRCEKCEERDNCTESDRFGWCDVPWITCHIKDQIKKEYELTGFRYQSITEQLEAIKKKE